MPCLIAQRDVNLQLLICFLVVSLFLDFPDIEAQRSDADLLEESFAMLAHGIFQIVEFAKPQNKLQRTLVEVFGIHTPSPVLFSFMMFMVPMGL